MTIDMSDAGSGRSLDAGPVSFVIVGGNRSVLHAARWLIELGSAVTGAASLDAARAVTPPPLAILVAGDVVEPTDRADAGKAATEIYLWDNEVGRPGVGDLACAVSGVSTVIGAADGPPGVMPAKIPEKWVGLFGASLALSLQVAQNQLARPRRIDVSAADLLRAFAEQNSGNHAGVPYGWRRNGRTAVEHGGVFPQGFFRCRDGYIAVQARSRPDWYAILAALGNPDWSRDAAFQNPFRLSEDDSKVAPLLDGELMKLDREVLLDRAIATGAPMAPVLSLEEAKAWHVFRPDFFDKADKPRPPFTVRRPTVR